MVVNGVGGGAAAELVVVVVGGQGLVRGIQNRSACHGDDLVGPRRVLESWMSDYSISEMQKATGLPLVVCWPPASPSPLDARTSPTTTGRIIPTI